MTLIEILNTIIALIIWSGFGFIYMSVYDERSHTATSFQIGWRLIACGPIVWLCAIDYICRGNRIGERQ